MFNLFSNYGRASLCFLIRLFYKPFFEAAPKTTTIYNSLSKFIFLTTHCFNFSAIFLFRYEEACKPGYSFGSEQSSGGTGHFTQVVWKGSTELGIGKANAEKNGMYCTYVVGRYQKAGNFIGKYKENVEKGSFSQDICNKLEEMIANMDGGMLMQFYVIGL